MPAALSRQVGDLRAFGRYARDLPRFLAGHPPPGVVEERIAADLRRRGDAFLETVDRAIYANPGSPYRRLLEHAGVEAGDVHALVADIGLEPALERLHAEGVRLSADEVHGRTAVERPGLEPFAVSREDIENPLARGVGYIGHGSRNIPRRHRFELPQLARETLHLEILHRATGVDGHTPVLWRPVPPGLSGMNDALRFARLGRPVERWFSQWPTGARPGVLRHAGFVAATRSIARRSGIAIPAPEHLPIDQAETIAVWLAERRAAGASPAYLATTSSCGVRVCAAALAGGHDISGTVFRLGGEPFTESRERMLADAGCRAVICYAMSETGRIANACGTPEHRDDVHVLLDKLALVQRPKLLPDGREVGALHCTTLLPGATMILLNVETDDYAELEERDCGCTLGELGFRVHLHTIRSYSKVNSEGMTFPGADLIRLLDDVLPGRFGGAPGQWQLAEEERGGVTRLAVVVSPRIGPLDDASVVAAVLEELGRGADNRRLQARMWREGGTVVVRREEPAVTETGKVLPLRPS